MLYPRRAAFGSWFANVGAPWVSRAVAVVGSAAIFALAHGSQNIPLFLDRFSFGVLAAWLVLRTGGLEAGIAMHVVNNLFAFGIAILTGTLDQALNVSQTSWWNIVSTVVQSASYLLIASYAAHRMRLQRVTAPPPGHPVPVTRM